ncbi:hypothetical protein BC832DRAFT_540323 [Gaertneriomyces semiglobifer]|nr:hypothetical protein BC832DRAFT_540323 [Gaertneriomyces semiglobifer]
MEKAATKLAHTLFTKHKIVGWTFGFDRAVRRYGVTKFGSKVISLSREWVNSPTGTLDNIRNTILHEIAHVLTPKHHHDAVWKAKAIEIGCTGERCGSYGSFVEKKWKIICKCGRANLERHRKPACLENKLKNILLERVDPYTLCADPSIHGIERFQKVEKHISFRSDIYQSIPVKLFDLLFLHFWKL